MISSLCICHQKEINRFCIECNLKLCIDCKHDENHRIDSDHIGQWLEVLFEIDLLYKDPNNPSLYKKLRNTITEDAFSLLDGIKDFRKQYYLKEIQFQPMNSLFLSSLGELLIDNNETVMVCGENMNRRDLFLKSIELDPSNHRAYHYLSNSLKVNEEIVLKNNKRVTPQDLYIKSIELNPLFPHSYLNLAKTMKSDVPFVIGQVEYTQRSLFFQAIELGPMFPNPYFGLGDTLEDNESTLMFPDGVTEMTRELLYKKAIEMNPLLSSPYFRLSTIADYNEVFEDVPYCKEPMDQKKLLVKCISLNPKNPDPYFNLADTIERDTVITLPYGMGDMNKIKLYLKCIELDPDTYDSYYFLSKELNNLGEEVVLPNGSIGNKTSLLLKSIDLNPDYPSSYLELFDILNNVSNNLESITLLNGITMGKLEILLKIIELRPNHSGSYYNLFNHFQLHFKNIKKEDKSFQKIFIRAYESLSNSSKRTFLKLIYLDKPNEEEYMYHFIKSLEISMIKLMNSDQQDPIVLLESLYRTEQVPRCLEIQKLIVLVLRIYGNEPNPHSDHERIYQSLVEHIKLTFTNSAHSHSQLLNILYLLNIISDVVLDFDRINNNGFKTFIKLFDYFLSNCHEIFLPNIYIKPTKDKKIQPDKYSITGKLGLIREITYQEVSVTLKPKLMNLGPCILFSLTQLLRYQRDIQDAPINTSNPNTQIDNGLSKEYHDEKEFTKLFEHFESLSSYKSIKSRAFYEISQLYKEPITLETKLYDSTDKLYLTSISLNPFSSADSYYQLSQSSTFNNDKKLKYLIRSIQLGTHISAAYYQCAKIFGSKCRKAVKQLIYDDSDISNQYLSSIDLLFRSIYYNPSDFSDRSYRYYLTIARYFLR